ncbi:MAG: MerR family transcriptional regulator [Dokdonella sp.]|uniref:MerR family transcriptional regulator n=1 Tax=Dokdonella sp. TaxID=2291710 RepID=UPI0032632F70
MTSTSRMTGLTPGTLRAWERRHRVVEPLRDAAGRRVYDAAMIERLTRLHRLTTRGHPIRRLTGLDDDALDGLLAESSQIGYGGVDTLCDRMLDAVMGYRIGELDRLLSVSIATLPPVILVTRVISPLLTLVGQRWVMGQLDIAQERLLSSLLRARMIAILNPRPSERGPRLLFATLPGEHHELGLLIAALIAYGAGAPLLYLGTDLPARDLAILANELGAKAVALSCVDSGLADAALVQVAELVAALKGDIDVWVGGAQADFICRKLADSRVRRVTDPALIERLVRRL